MSEFNASAFASIALANPEAYENVRALMSEEQCALVSEVIAEREAEQARAVLAKAFADGTPSEVVGAFADALPVLGASLAAHGKTRINAVGKPTRTVNFALPTGEHVKFVVTSPAPGE